MARQNKTKLDKDFITQFTGPNGTTYLLAEVRVNLPGGIASSELLYVNVGEGIAAKVALIAGAASIDDPRSIEAEEVIRFIDRYTIAEETKNKSDSK